MIKRYILHIEAHKNVFRYRPRISFKRAPRPGDRVKDGGVWGTLRRCPTCQEGFLHEPDPPRVRTSRPRPPKPPLLGLILSDLARNLSQPHSYPARPVRTYHTPRPAMDFNAPEHVELKVTEPETEAPVVDLTIIEPSEHVELKVEDEEESPETLELDYKLGTRKYKGGEELWTHNAKYIVEKLEDDILYLVRKDIWKARKKKAKHVEIKVDEPAEHVELETEDEKSSEVVQLKFD